MSRSEKVAIPQSKEELTAEWFTSVLGRGRRVTDVDTRAVGTDVGFMGEVYRCSLSWTGDEATSDLPPSVIVKVPSDRPDNKALGEALQVYEREIAVYQTLHRDLGIPMPDHHYSAMDPDPAPWLERPVQFLLRRLPVGGVGRLIDRLIKLGEKSKRRYVLVIEDIVDARPPYQIEGGSLEDSEIALRILAQFHAANWMRRDVLGSPTKIYPLNLAPKATQAIYRRTRNAFVERWGESVGRPVVERLDAVQERCLELNDRICEEPWTILHGDYRLDNLLFRPDGEVVVIDYQLVTRGRPGFDVAYFITTALSAEHKSEEHALMRSYHEALVEAGVSEYAWDDLVADCSLSKDLLAHRLVATRHVLDSDIAGFDESFVDLLVTRLMGWVDV